MAKKTKSKHAKRATTSAAARKVRRSRNGAAKRKRPVKKTSARKKAVRKTKKPAAGKRKKAVTKNQQRTAAKKKASARKAPSARKTKQSSKTATRAKSTKTAKRAKTAALSAATPGTLTVAPIPAPVTAETKPPVRTPAKPPAAPPAKPRAKLPPAPQLAVRPQVTDAPARRSFYITTAISYPNGVPHIGHAYEAIATDAIARFMRLDGYDVFFLTGTDEHGQKIQQTAVKEGLSPRDLVDRNAQRFREMVARMNCSNDDFIRTTEARHHAASRAIWERMEANGDIYLAKYAGWYSVRDERYFAEDETRLNEQGARVAVETGTPVDWVEEESYFFRLSAYQDKLLALYAEHPDFVLPKERLNEVASFVKGGLQDLSISRTTFDWGVRVPGNDKHIMYVWVDALTNYITAVGYPDVGSATFRKYWPADLHVIGKDIVRFHAVYWPAFLMSAGVAVPRRIFSHGFLFNRGEKMSKSVGNVIDPFALADAYGVDQLRYFFLREVPFGQDGNYSHEAIVTRINAELANDLGNLAQRSLSMVAKQLGGVMPAPGGFSEADRTILESADAMIEGAREAMKTQALHQVLNQIWAVVADANRYFAGEAPWALAKTDPARQATVLYVTAEVIRQVAILAQPFIPQSAGKLLDLLAVPEGERDFARLGGTHRLASGVSLPAPVGVFPRYVEAEAGNP
ncbi:methionine--tRNA ligase [Pseudorhodoplanes sp.]|uniref:methionine--tRNA ligase n=1 Tax=Pseudorhodoplanes sp. TaxID=1934341 RepID=UPI003919F61F